MSLPEHPTNLEYIVFLVAFDRNDKPVLIVEVKDDSWARRPETRFSLLRGQADARSHCYNSMFHDCYTPSLGSQCSLRLHARLLW
jgi:hypothetical protein